MGIKNQIKTVILLGLLTALLLWVGYLVGGPSGLTIGLIFALLMNFGSYWFSDKIVLKIYKAKIAKKTQEPRLYKIVKEVSSLAGLPMPKIYIIPSEQSNAFACGRSPKHSSVACTQAILKLNDDELRGVIAHELSHIKNRDTLIATIAATIAGVISYVAFMARFAAIFGGGRNSEGGGNIISLLVLAILTPILAMIIQLAISRSREYLADSSAAKILKNSQGLADALEKLEIDAKRHPMKLGNPSTAHLFITNPFRGKSLMNLFSTHPNTQNRVKRLRNMNF